ncbi:hypothetical protein CspHIS471_0602180 [Cutaneotrichosporon sp. HIS471]|nr:hypothetical protein CspHIS471_0602180 [Cutaneotrichosporon sp. HIS471]
MPSYYTTGPMVKHLCRNEVNCVSIWIATANAFLIAVVLLALMIFEIKYVNKHHGGRMGWRHSLAYLETVPENDRGSPYAYMSANLETPQYNSDIPGDLLSVEEAPIISAFPIDTYNGQGDAPPEYPGNSAEAPVPSATGSQNSRGPITYPSPPTESDAQPLSSAGPSRQIDESLPAFDGPSGGGAAGYSAHKEALLEKGRPIGP